MRLRYWDCDRDGLDSKILQGMRHYTTKHASKFDSVVGRARTDLINSLKQSIAGRQSFFKLANQSSEAATKISFLIAGTIAKKGKPFSDGQLVKDCLQIFTDVVFQIKSLSWKMSVFLTKLLLGELMTWHQILKTHWSRDLAVASSTA